MAVLRSKPSADVARYRCEVQWVSCPGECSRPTAFSRPSGDLVKRSAPASDTRARIFGRTCHSWARSREHVSLLSAETLRAPYTQLRGRDTRVTSGARVTRGRGVGRTRMDRGARGNHRRAGLCRRRGCAWQSLPHTRHRPPRLYTGAPANTLVSRRPDGPVHRRSTGAHLRRF